MILFIAGFVAGGIAGAFIMVLIQAASILNHQEEERDGIQR